MVLSYLCSLIIGFIMLYKGSDYFVDGSIALANKLKIPTFIVGLTIVGVGTSLPETAVSLAASFDKNADICIGNVVGSNILNIMIILGISALILPLSISIRTLYMGIPFMAFASFLLLAFGKNGIISQKEGGIFLIIFIIYLLFLISFSKKNKEITDSNYLLTPFKIFLYIVLGLLAIIFGSKLTVYSATVVAEYFNISDRFIALTVVALGTSLPELFTSVNAASKGNADIAIGNIIGSNIYNILFIVGLTSQFTPIPFQQKFQFDTFFSALVCLALLLLCLPKQRLSTTGGCILLFGYLGYFLYLL